MENQKKRLTINAIAILVYIIEKKIEKKKTNIYAFYKYKKII